MYFSLHYLFPVCEDYYPNPAPECADDQCTCTKQSDCYPNEICCLRITTDAPFPTPTVAADTKLLCYSTIEPPPTSPPGKTSLVRVKLETHRVKYVFGFSAGARCPTTTPPLQCAPFQNPGSCLIPGTPPTSTCRTNEICCTVTRGDPCCVVY